LPTSLPATPSLYTVHCMTKSYLVAQTAHACTTHYPYLSLTELITALTIKS